MAIKDSDSVRHYSGEKDIGEYTRTIDEPHTSTPTSRDTSLELE